MSVAENDENIQVFPLLVNANAGLPIPAVRFAPPSAPPNFTESDLNGLNELAKLLLQSPGNPFPTQTVPGPNVRSQKIAKAKDDGNLHFKKGEWADAVRLYTLSAELAAARPMIESSMFPRDELAISLCNRSAAYTNMKEYVNALVDARAVIEYKPSWTKGYFRKGKALMGMDRLDEAKEAFLLGLQFDPSTEVSTVAPSCWRNLSSLRWKFAGSHYRVGRSRSVVEAKEGVRVVIQGAGAHQYLSTSFSSQLRSISAIATFPFFFVTRSKLAGIVRGAVSLSLWWRGGL